MIRAYQEIYLSKAQSVLGDAFDYAVNSCSIPGDEFVKLFVVSDVSKSMARGDSKYLLGKSGIEVTVDVIEETTGKCVDIEPQENMSRSKEYWIGWAVAYYQWYSDRKYSEIFKAMSFDDLQEMYYTLHEADISKFVEIADQKVIESFPDTNLKRFRNYYGCTQAELSKLSGVGLRSIQMYEQRKKDINKASVETVYKIAKVFGCSIEDLMEK